MAPFEVASSRALLAFEHRQQRRREDAPGPSSGRRARDSGSGRRDHGDQPQRKRSEETKVVRRERVEMKGSGAVLHADYEAREVRKEKPVEYSRGKTVVEHKCHRDRDSGSVRRDHGDQPQRKRSEETEVVRREHVEMKVSGAVLHADYEARAVRKEESVEYPKGKTAVEEKYHRDRDSGSGRRDHGDQPQRKRSEETEVVRRERVEMKVSGAVLHADYEARVVRKEESVEYSRGKTAVEEKYHRDRDSGSGRRDHGDQPQRKRSEETKVVRRERVEMKGSGAVLHADNEARAVRKEKYVEYSRGKTSVEEKRHVVMHREHKSNSVGNQEMKGKNTGGSREIARGEHHKRR